MLYNSIIIDPIIPFISFSNIRA